MKKGLKIHFRRIYNTRFVLILYGTLMLLSACEKILLNRYGKEININKLITPFSEIAIYDIFDIELKSDSLYSLQLFGYSEYLENISVIVDSGILRIRDRNNYKWLADYPRTKITIGFPKIDTFSLHAPVHLVSSDTLKLEKFVLVSLGRTAEINLTLDVDYLELGTSSFDFGYYIFKGKAKSCFLWQQGSSIVDARELVSKSCFVFNYSVGNTFVNVLDKLEVHLYSLGNIFYLGNPETTSEQNNKGKLLRLTK
jgi:hypothetical protein